MSSEVREKQEGEQKDCANALTPRTFNRLTRLGLVTLCVFLLTGCTTSGMGFPRFKRANEYGQSLTEKEKR